MTEKTLAEIRGVAATASREPIRAKDEKELDYALRADSLLRAKNPVAELEKVCREIKIPQSLKEYEVLWQQKRRWELMYRTLPTLLSSLRNFSWCGLEENALFQEGFLTFFQSIVDWNPKRRLGSGKTDSLTGYTSRKVYVALGMFVTEEYGLNFSTENIALIKLYRRCWCKFEEENIRVPTLAEISELMNKENKGQLPLKLWQGGMKVDKIALIYFSSMEPLENEAVGIAGDVEEEVVRSSLKDALQKVLGDLSKKQREAIKLRFGLDDGVMRTLEEVGKLMGITNERVRQIEADALRKLRHPLRSRRFKDYR